MRQFAFAERVDCQEDEEFIASGVDVEVSPDGYFVSVVSCPYEGNAHFTLPVAKALLPVLQRAVEAAERARRKEHSEVPT